MLTKYKSATALLFAFALIGCGVNENSVRASFEGSVDDMDGLQFQNLKTIKKNGIKYTCGEVRYGSSGDYTPFVIEGTGEPFVSPLAVLAADCFREDLPAEMDKRLGTG